MPARRTCDALSLASCSSVPCRLLGSPHLEGPPLRVPLLGGSGMLYTRDAGLPLWPGACPKWCPSNEQADGRWFIWARQSPSRAQRWPQAVDSLAGWKHCTFPSYSPGFKQPAAPPAVGWGISPLDMMATLIPLLRAPTLGATVSSTRSAACAPCRPSIPGANALQAYILTPCPRMLQLT